VTIFLNSLRVIPPLSSASYFSNIISTKGLEEDNSFVSRVVVSRVGVRCGGRVLFSPNPFPCIGFDDEEGEEDEEEDEEVDRYTDDEEDGEVNRSSPWEIGGGVDCDDEFGEGDRLEDEEEDDVVEVVKFCEDDVPCEGDFAWVAWVAAEVVVDDVAIARIIPCLPQSSRARADGSTQRKPLLHDHRTLQKDFVFVCRVDS